MLSSTVMTAHAATKLVPDTNYSDIIMNISDDSYADDDPYTNQGIITSMAHWTTTAHCATNRTPCC